MRLVVAAAIRFQMMMPMLVYGSLTNAFLLVTELCPQKWTFGHTKTDTYRFKEQFHRFETVMPETRYVDDVSH